MKTSLDSYMRSLPRLLVVKTDEEARLIEEIHRNIGSEDEFYVWNPTFGMLPSAQYIDEWRTLRHDVDKDTANINSVLIQMYKTPHSEQESPLYYMILDADRFMSDPHIQRRLKNIAISGSINDITTRTVILVSQSGHVPATLDPYVVYLDFDEPDDDLIRQVLQNAEAEIRSYDETFTLPADREEDTIPDEFVEVCRGLTVFQIKETIIHFAASQGLRVTLQDMREYRKSIIQKTSLLDILETDITFEDVAGLDHLKEYLTEVRSAFSKEGREYGVPVSRGLLQIGVPGCGKSLIAKALANEMGINFVQFDPANLFSSRVGDSERNMRTALSYIEAIAPAVVFIDEIEKGLAGIQSSSQSDSGTTARVIGTFLTWFQDHDEDIFVIATANGVSSLPPELISRFDEKFFVGLPAYEARRDCFEIQFNKYWRPAMGSLEDLDFDAMATASESLTGREIEKVVTESIRKAFNTPERIVTTPIVLDVIENKPPLILTMQEDIEAMLEWVGYDPSRRDGIRAKYASKEELVENSAVIFEQDSIVGKSRMGALFGKKDTEPGNLN